MNKNNKFIKTTLSNNNIFVFKYSKNGIRIQKKLKLFSFFYKIQTNFICNIFM